MYVCVGVEDECGLSEASSWSWPPERLGIGRRAGCYVRSPLYSLGYSFDRWCSH
jgi:hypothetical protein